MEQGNSQWAAGVSRWAVAMPEEPTIGLESWGFQRDAISPTSTEQTGLEAEFHQMARDLINYTYTVNTQSKLWIFLPQVSFLASKQT